MSGAFLGPGYFEYLSLSGKPLVVWIPDTIRNISLKSFITEKNKYTLISTFRFYLKRPRSLSTMI